ncbi:pilus assembly protein CpaB [Roseibium hamelinense]|uniref:Pilus assembly protein CpaB n=1 Tax=Roseibium hamelinense TaxID=150831 RepID=A0A562SHJ8_9HYPH|nr:Flp pilus assembly protein CpaB [Roseibium hamelinense]MTI43918.1 Flp pilus assembly protein CpaB [Roseibium hamelinense]TWI80787.1 pilus assembly protein CpaB [Roseibium hamelinense]
MKLARLLILVIALGAGLLAARLVMNSGSPAPEPVAAPAQETDTVEVLVASKDIQLGGKITPGDVTWSAWPKSAIPKGVATKEAEPDADKVLLGRIARVPIFEGEPVRQERLISTDKGFMAAILPKGMRAIAVSVEAETTAGGFILPGDKVDLILTREEEERGAISETILENVRVLAIDGTTAGEQEEKNLSPKRTATLELDPAETEIVALSQQLGTISLALRSAQDSADDAEETVRRRDGVGFLKYGIPTRANIQ